MTIKEVIRNIEIANLEDKVKRLMNAGATPLMVRDLREMLFHLELGGSLYIRGEQELFNTEYVDMVEKVEKGGRRYLSFNGGSINYFPNGKYGRYITSASKKGTGRRAVR